MCMTIYRYVYHTKSVQYVKPFAVVGFDKNTPLMGDNGNSVRPSLCLCLCLSILCSLRPPPLPPLAAPVPPSPNTATSHRCFFPPIETVVAADPAAPRWSSPFPLAETVGPSLPASSPRHCSIHFSSFQFISIQFNF